MPGTGGGGRGWSGNGQAFQSATAGATGYVLLLFPGVEPKPPPPSMVLTDLYSAELRQLNGAVLVPAVSTEIISVDGQAQTTDATSLTTNPIQSNLVGIRTTGVFAPRCVVEAHHYVNVHTLAGVEYLAQRREVREGAAPFPARHNVRHPAPSPPHPTKSGWRTSGARTAGRNLWNW